MPNTLNVKITLRVLQNKIHSINNIRVQYIPHKMPAQQKELKTETGEKKYMIQSPPKKSPNACSLPSLPLIAYGEKRGKWRSGSD